jgi:hypothetical protein
MPKCSRRTALRREVRTAADSGLMDRRRNEPLRADGAK